MQVEGLLAARRHISRGLRVGARLAGEQQRGHHSRRGRLEQSRADVRRLEGEKDQLMGTLEKVVRQVEAVRREENAKLQTAQQSAESARADTMRARAKLERATAVLGRAEQAVGAERSRSEALRERLKTQVATCQEKDTLLYILNNLSYPPVLSFFHSNYPPLSFSLLVHDLRLFSKKVAKDQKQVGSCSGSNVS